MYSNTEKSKNPFLKNSSHLKNNNNNFYKPRKQNEKNFYKPKEKEIDLSVEAFPSLDRKNTALENIKVECLDYTKLQTTTQEDITVSKVNKIAPGWQIIYKENNKIVKKCGPSTIKTNKTVSKTNQEETMQAYKILSNHWNNYRDELNNLLGQQSEYWNYKNNINEIYKEEISILNQMDENMNLSNSDDEEELYNEITDNYDFY